jgi:hypothetical protein
MKHLPLKIKYTLILFILISFTGSFTWAQDSSNAVVRYNGVLRQIKQSRELIKSSSPATVRTQKASRLLLKNLSDSVFPAWYGTKWDFNGITNVPQQGLIACGYFVSTTLKHVGFNLNRYKMAQQAASVIINETCGRSFVKKYNNSDTLLNVLRKKPDGLYVLGLDYHVGFLLVQKGKVYFVHSDFANGKVVRELATVSIAFNATVLYVVGQLTNNKVLMNKWLKGTRIYG